MPVAAAIPQRHEAREIASIGMPVGGSGGCYATARVTSRSYAGHGALLNPNGAPTKPLPFVAHELLHLGRRHSRSHHNSTEPETMTTQTADQTVRVGVFNTTEQASRA